MVIGGQIRDVHYSYRESVIFRYDLEMQASREQIRSIRQAAGYFKAAKTNLNIRIDSTLSRANLRFKSHNPTKAEEGLILNCTLTLTFAGAYPARDRTKDRQSIARRAR